MKILHINSYFSVSKFYKNFFDKQKQLGLDLDVFVPVDSSYSSNLNFGDYTTISANYKKYERFIFHLKQKKILKDISSIYEIPEYTIIHSHTLFTNGHIAMELKKKFGIPYVVAVRNTDVHTFFKYMLHLRKTGIKILKEAERVIFLSSSYRDIIIQKYIPTDLKNEILSKSNVISNGIDDFWFENKGLVKKIDENNLRLLYVGVINKNKNLITTIQAIELLRKKGFEITFTIVGSIADTSIYNYINSLPYVNYVEPKPKEELLKIYRSNDIFVMPSIHETFGLVYAEALSQGLPIIYTKNQGFDGQFRDGTVGYSVDCFSPQDIADSIVAIIENYTTISNSCIEVVEKFHWKEITYKYLMIYKSAIKNISGVKKRYEHQK